MGDSKNSYTMITSMWAFMASWFTPIYLFLFLNLVIGIVILNSRKKPQHHQHDHLRPDNSHPLARAPSLLARVKSFNFSLYKFDQPTPPETEFNPPQTTVPGSVTHYVPDHQPQLVRTPLLDRLKSIKLSSLYNRPETEILEAARPERERVHVDPNQSTDTDHDDHLVRSKSDRTCWDTTSSQHPEKMKKSAIVKTALARFEEDEIMERPVPATTRVEKWSDKKKSEGEDEGVDAKADDFINKFKQQLRLQRLDSLKRFSGLLKGKQS